MEFLDESKITKILDGIIIVLLLIIMGILIKDVFFDKECECETTDNLISVIDKEESNEEAEEDNQTEEIVKMYTIDIKGAVKNPGVYKVNEETIINDVIKLAGGLKSNASTKYINLSKKVSDEMVLVIYTNSEINKLNNPSNQVCEVSTEDIKTCDGSSVIVSNNENGNIASDKSKDDTVSNKVSINNGTKEQLMTLNGVGEAKALAIIEYRTTNNGFKTLEEIMNVSGIGEQAYNKIKDDIML